MNHFFLSFSCENKVDSENFQLNEKTNVIDENFYSSSIEKDESLDELNRLSLTYFDKKQRKIDHRRNKSEPLIISNPNSIQITFESSSASTTSNESNKQIKSSSKKPKKAWYNVSISKTTHILHIFSVYLNAY